MEYAKRILRMDNDTDTARSTNVGFDVLKKYGRLSREEYLKCCAAVNPEFDEVQYLRVLCWLNQANMLDAEEHGNKYVSAELTRYAATGPLGASITIFVPVPKAKDPLCQFRELVESIDDQEVLLEMSAILYARRMAC